MLYDHALMLTFAVLRTRIEKDAVECMCVDNKTFGTFFFYFIRTIFIRMLRLRFAPKFKKMCALKLEHPQAQPNCTRSY